MARLTCFPVCDRVGVHGKLNKETADMARAVANFSGWLDGGEQIQKADRFTVARVDQPLATAWQTDYPFEPSPGTSELVDTFPLIVPQYRITSGRTVDVFLSLGTPGLTYRVSFLASGESGREKQVNFLVSIATTLLGPSSMEVCGTVIHVRQSTALATSLIDATATIVVENTTGAPVTITLPSNPCVGQVVRGIDGNGNAVANTITWVGADGTQIDRQNSYRFEVAFQAADFQWVGDQWVAL